MKAETTLIINDLSGSINEYVGPGLLKTNQFSLLLNVNQSQLGNLAHRLGTNLFLNLVSGANQVRGLQMFYKDDNTYFLHMVHQGNIYVSNEAGAVWTSQVTQANSGLATTSEVDFTNFIGRHYYVGNNATDLRYVTETGAATIQAAVTGTVDASSTASTLIATTSIFNVGMVGLTITNITDAATRTITAYTSPTQVTVNSAINDTWDGDSIAIYLKGKYLATNGAYMMLAGNDIYPRRGYWTSLEGSTTNVPFIDVGADYAITDKPHTGVASFGNGRDFIIFTRDNYLTVNPRNGATIQVDDFGCVSHRSISVVQGTAVWLSDKGFMALAYNQAYPQDISLPIKNDLTFAAIFNSINRGTLSATASGVIDDRYFCALQNLTGPINGQTINDCVVEYDFGQSVWRVHSYTAGGLAAVFAKFINLNNQHDLYAGSMDNSAVYKLEVPGIYTDANSAGTPVSVSSVIQTKHYDFGFKDMADFKNITKIMFKYRSTGTITVRYALDGATTYTALPAVLPISPAGVDWTWQYFIFGKECRTISLEIESSGEYIIHHIGFTITSLTVEGILPI